MGEPSPFAEYGARIVDIPGAHNLRDLGGLPVRGGGRTAFGRLYRSEFLAPPAFVASALGPATRPGEPSGPQLRTVVDLRRTSELAHEQVAWGAHQVQLLHCPLRLSRGTSWSAGYHRYLEDGAPEFVAAVEVLINPVKQPALFHCAAGKDRTGVIAAVLLDLAGVPQADIVHDYTLTAITLDTVLSRLAAQDPYRGVLGGAAATDHAPVPEIMESFLSWLTTQGGAEGWLVDHGVDRDALQAFRAVMVVRS